MASVLGPAGGGALPVGFDYVCSGSVFEEEFDDFGVASVGGFVKSGFGAFVPREL